MLLAAVGANAATVTGGGYTTAFSTQPAAADWTTYTISGAAGDITTAAGLDGSVGAVAASSIVNALGTDAGTPPAAGSAAVWSSTGQYVQTRPTGVQAELLMLTLVNGLTAGGNPVDASSFTLSYDFTKEIPVVEEIDGHRVYYSLSGAPGSWVPIASLTAANAGHLSATVTVSWPAGSHLYLLWADDNGSGSPDTSMEIDNVSVTAVPAVDIPASITTQPTNTTVAELSPFSFSVGVAGNPRPTIQWYKNNAPLAGETNGTYSSVALLADNNAVFYATASNVASGTTYVVPSANATLTVVADTTKPTLAAVSTSGGILVQVTFSEPVSAATATNLANYRITNIVGSLQISNAVLASDQTNVTLTTGPQTIGATYTLIVSGVRDMSAAANMILTNSTFQFIAVSITTSDIGSPSISGSATAVGGTGFNVSGSGSGVGNGASDQFTFSYQSKAGDFDVKVRVSDFTGTDPFAEAALMARDTLNSGSMFAAAIAAPPMTGCFFESRTTTGAGTTRAGTFPTTYPNMWVRLKRTLNVFTGYASADGRTWVQLGSATLSVGSVYLGFSVTSHDATKLATAQFRDYGDTDIASAQVVSSVSFASEPLTAVARTGPMVISEIMYKPGGTNTNGFNTEFIELYNSNPYYEDISGYQLAGDISFTFPSNTIVPAGGFVVLAKYAAAVQAKYGITGVYQYGVTNVSYTTNIVGNITNIAASTNVGPSLPESGTIRLLSDVGAILLEVNYANDNPWPVGANGTGHSLVVTRGSYGQNDPRSWDVSDRVGGSPGRHEPLRIKTGLRSVVINEVLAHSDPPLLDYIELYNYSSQSVDISGCSLSDDPGTNKFHVAAGTILPPRGFAAFNQDQLGFALSHNGESIFLRSPDGTQMLDALRFDDQESAVAYGRFPDGADQFYRLTTRTPGTNNAAILIDDIVINEIMYGPISEEADDQYVELYNKGTNAVNLGNWKFVSAISYTFPSNAVILPDGYLVVARNLTNLLAHYGNLNQSNTVGNFGGKLSRTGERLALAKPEAYTTTNSSGQLKTNTHHVVVEEVTYGTGGRWGQWANQGGSSLELIDPRANHRLAYNWGDSDETQKAPWTPFEANGILDTGSVQGGGAIDRLEITMLGEGECLVDDLEVHSPATSGNFLPNPGFELGLTSWSITGNHIDSFIENAGRGGGKALHVRTDGNGDTGANTIRSTLTTSPIAGQVGVLRGYVRWLRGWPEITLRLRGGYLEAYGRMALPNNLGTPGARNSRAATNNAPAIYGVVHSPVLPQSSDSIVITAGVQDPDGVSNVTLFWRIDSATPPPYTATLMNDSGINGDAVAGDGIYSATLPAQANGTMIAFFVDATDSRGASNRFPVNATAQRECLVRCGDPLPISAFASYRLWMSRANVNAYINRPALSNKDVDGTLVVGNNRVIYNMGSHYSNSPYHQGQNSSPETGSTHFDMHVPPDDMYLGTENFNKVHAPGNGGFDDTTLQREQTAYWFARRLGLPYLYRRYVAMYVNGNRKGGANALQEDTQRPGGEMIDEWFSSETAGRLFKIQPWFEFQNDFSTLTAGASAAFDNKLWCTLTKNSSTNLHKIARYRQNWLTRSADKTANDYTNVMVLIDSANVPTTNPQYWANISSLIDVEQWARIWAVEHAVGNWDSFGNRNAQNMYGYKPDHGKWKLMIWDLNIVLGSSAGPDTPGVAIAPNPSGQQATWGNLFQYQYSQDPTAIGNINQHPAMRRAWWRAYKELTAMPGAYMHQADTLLDAKYKAFQNSGINPLDPSSIKSFIATARQNISNAVVGVDINSFTLTTNSITTGSNYVTISGAAGIDVFNINVDGEPWPITWTSVSNWSIVVPITNNATLNISATTKTGKLFTSPSQVQVNYSAPAAPDPAGWVVFNEIMYHAGSYHAEYIELYNAHTNYTFNLGGWRINGADFTFPDGTYFPPKSYLLVVKDRVAFEIVYGVSLPIVGEYSGSLQDDGETLTLLRPGATATNDMIVVDKVRYEGDLPYPAFAVANGTGSSVQLVDVVQDNARAGDWTARFVPAVYSLPVSTPAHTNDGWRFVSITSTFGSNNRLLVYLDNAGSVLLDDIAVVAGTNAATGFNYVRNGDFEAPLTTNDWVFGTNMSAASLITDNVHSGAAALRLVQDSPGSASVIGRDLLQLMSPVPTNQQICTLSFWYWATNNSASTCSVRVVSSGLSLSTNFSITVVPSNYVPAQLISPAIGYATPGAPNSFNATIAPFEPLWINEVQAENISGIRDAAGQNDPWIEIYNAGTNAVALDGLYLSPSYTNLTAWQFPPGSSIAAGTFKVIWCDGQPGQTSASEIHTSFRLAPVTGSIALSRISNNATQVLDYVNYSELHADRSYGSYPDGQPFDRFEFYYVTPGGTNDPRPAPLTVFINEWMASNTNTVADPADGKFSDWFEVYNPGPSTVDLSGFYFTDTATNKTKFRVTTTMAHTIAPGGHLLVWADSDTGQNGSNVMDLHVSFKLSKSGGQIGLYAFDGTVVDLISYSTGLVNTAEGRYPDGSGHIYYLTTPTPRAANYLAGAPNTAPVLAAIADKVVYLGNTLSFTATATDNDVPAQVLGFSLDPGAPAGATITSSGSFAWTPSALGNYTITVRVTDSGDPPMNDSKTFHVNVYNLPQLGAIKNTGSGLSLSWQSNSNQVYRLEYKADINEPSWTFLQDIVGTGSTITITNIPTAGQQRFFRVTVLP